MSIGAYRQEPYRRDTSRITSLIAREGDIQAGREVERGQIIGGAIQQVGSIAAKGLMDYAGYKASEPARRHEARKMKREASDMDRQDALDVTYQEIGSLDPVAGAKVLRARGFAKEADTIEKAANERTQATLDTMSKQYKLAQDKITAAGTMLESVLAVAPQNQPQQYAAVLGKVREMVGPELSQALPDQFDPAVVQQALGWGMSQRDKVATRHAIASEARDAAKDLRDRHTWGLEFLGKWSSTVDNQAEWDEMLTGAAALGVPAETTAILGKEYSPAAVQELQAMARPMPRAAAAPSVGSFGDYLERVAKTKGVSVDDLPAATVASERRKWESLGWKPDSPAGVNPQKPISQEAYATASRAKATALAAIEKELRERRNTRDPMSETELEQRKARVLEEFNDQIGATRSPGQTKSRMGDRGRGASAPIQFRGPKPEPTSSQQPQNLVRQLPDGSIMSFESEEQYDEFLRLAGLSRQ